MNMKSDFLKNSREAFGKDFIWGAATAACQIEGAALEDGKGMSVWDSFAQVEGNIQNQDTPMEACDHYHHVKEDVALMKKIGIKAYRFSISWPRIMPQGTGEINQKGIDFYNNLIDDLLKNGIEPYITLYHWDLPYALHLQGGWMNSRISDWFAQYARVIVENFSDRVTHYMTFNEPQAFVGAGYLIGMHAPGWRVTPQEGFLIAHNVLLAHGKAVKNMREYAKQKLVIGAACCGDICFPDSEKEEDIAAARQMMFTPQEDPRGLGNRVNWFADPIYLGHYSQEGVEKYSAYLPAFADKDMELIHQPLEFMGQNIYQGMRVRAGKDGKPEVVKLETGHPMTACGWPVTPECMYWGARFLYERYHKDILITENGCSCLDAVSSDGRVHDLARIDYLSAYLTSLARAVRDAVPVKGYFMWSLMDNFEWASGYSQRFGMVYVDYATKQRILKDSAYWYRDWIGKGAEHDDNKKMGDF